LSASRGMTGTSGNASRTTGDGGCLMYSTARGASSGGLRADRAFLNDASLGESLPAGSSLNASAPRWPGRRRAAHPDCKLATLNQLFGADAARGPNWSGLRLLFARMVNVIASAEWQEAVAGRLLDWHFFWCENSRLGAAGVGDVLNEARA
jgi:hypothetical protein